MQLYHIYTAEAVRGTTPTTTASPPLTTSTAHEDKVTTEQDRTTLLPSSMTTPKRGDKSMDIVSTTAHQDRITALPSSLSTQKSITTITTTAQTETFQKVTDTTENSSWIFR